MIMSRVYESALNWPLAALLASISFILLLLHFHYKNKYNYWQQHGVKGPPPTIIFGHMLQLLRGNFMNIQLDWLKTYGKCYGFYLGTKPILAICDPEVNQEICVKQFDIFPDHDFNRMLTKYQKNFIFFISGQRWKRVRALMTPTFTSGKIKRMYKLIQVCVQDLLLSFDDLLAKLQTANKTSEATIVNVKDVYSLYTLDAITACCYGLRLEREGSSDIKTAASRNYLAKAVLGLFTFRKLRVLFVAMMPARFLEFIGFTMVKLTDVEPLAKIAEKIVDKRRSLLDGNSKKFDDYLQILVDAKLGDEFELGDLDEKENHHAGLTKKTLIDDQNKILSEVLGDSTTNGNHMSKDKTNGESDFKLTDMEIISGAMFLLAVGLETTATLLTNASYALAFYQDVQDRLYEEVKKIADPETGEFSYEDVTSCLYLDSVISESLRILPPVVRLDRVAKADFKIEKYNILVEKGTEINLMSYSLLNDPDSWDKPEQFNPERFMPGQREKNVPGSYCPFGIGPRHCLGMRFSLTEAKLALASVVMKYRFQPAPGTSFPPQSTGSIIVNKIDNPIVQVIKRSA